jgi:apolipoprotein N-acyltransferase
VSLRKETISLLATLQDLSHRIILAEGGSRRAIAFIAGATGALALAPFDVVPAMAVPLCVAVWLIDGASGVGVAAFRSAAGAGWWLGFGYFVAGLWWLGAAMLVEADQFAWALPLAVLGLPAGLALFTALGFALARAVWSPGSLRVFALAAGLGGAEWLRGHIFTGFPWNDFGMALAAAGPLAQTASLIGLHGLDLAAIVIFAVPATLIDAPVFGRTRNIAIWVAVALLAGMAQFGALRLATGRTEYAPGVKLRLMQPNLPQDAKFKPQNGPAILDRYLNLSNRAASPERRGAADVTHIVWPESAFPFILSKQPEALSAIAHTLQGAVLLTGAARVEEDGDGGGKIFNSIEVVQGDQIVAYFDKIHLVPFGEYLPMEKFLKPLGLTQLVPGIWDSGAGPRELSAPGLPLMAPLICYEAIFSGRATESGADRPQPRLLLNVTNDGWFGLTSGPYQHFAQARLRAIEEGLPLIRVANTGVSAIVDPWGRVLNFLPLGAEGVIDGRLPLPTTPTVFSRRGRAAFPALWLLMLLIALFGRAQSLSWRPRVAGRPSEIQHQSPCRLPVCRKLRVSRLASVNSAIRPHELFAISLTHKLKLKNNEWE